MADVSLNPNKPNHIYLIYMDKEGLALNNLQWLICHKTKLYLSFCNSRRYLCLFTFFFSIINRKANNPTSLAIKQTFLTFSLSIYHKFLTLSI